MKKLLILMLVLGMASVANAALQISVHTSPRGGETWDPYNPQDTEITIDMSDYLEIDIHDDAGQGMFEAHVWGLIVSTVDATISGGVGLNPGGATGVATSIIGEVSDAWVINPVGSEGYYGATLAGFSGGPIGEYYNEFLLHCEKPLGDATIELWELVDTGQTTENWEFTTLLDAVVIHQIPEPMTIALLGLGSLFLLRRRK